MRLWLQAHFRQEFYREGSMKAVRNGVRKLGVAGEFRLVDFQRARSFAEFLILRFEAL